ncbi:MAG: acyl-CoA thioesterase [Chloroflexi bacterium]|nr:acyl-CoA thioesterase [Chloroflexota bacterium]
MPKEDFRFHTTIRVRWAECDAQDIVYYPNYLTWLEVALTEYCRHLGFNLYRLAELDLFDTVTAKLTVEYKAPAKVDDLLDVYARLAGIGNTSYTFAYEVHRPSDERLLVAAEVVYVSYHNQAHRPRRVPQPIRDVFNHFEATGQPLPLAEMPLFADALA